MHSYSAPILSSFLSLHKQIAAGGGRCCIRLSLQLQADQACDLGDVTTQLGYAWLWWIGE